MLMILSKYLLEYGFGPFGINNANDPASLSEIKQISHLTLTPNAFDLNEWST